MLYQKAIKPITWRRMLYLLGLLVFSLPKAYGVQTLKFLTWEDYISPEVISSFEKEYNAKIEFVYFDHDEERDDLMAANNAAYYDIIMVDGHSMPSYKRLNWVSRLSVSQVPGLANYDDVWRKIRPEAVGFAFPYGWGTYGIAYRKDLVDQKPDSLMVLFKPDDSLKGKVIMSPQAFELVHTALMALGYDITEDSEKAFIEVEQLLYQQKPYVHSYQALELDESSPLVTGEALVAQAYNGDTLVLQDINENIDYVIPKEGSQIWIDFLCISTNSKKKELAYSFLQFLSKTEITKKNIEYTYTASFHGKANDLLPDEIRNNPIVFHPNIESLSVAYEPKSKVIRRTMGIVRNLRINSHRKYN